MLDKIHIFTDGHEGAPKAWFITPQEMVEFDKSLNHVKEKVYLLGDNFDLKNTKKKWIALETLEYIKVKKYFKERMVDGNHTGCVRGTIQTYEHWEVINGKLFLFIHGHRIFWTPKKAQKWEAKEFEGIGFWKYKCMQAVNFPDETFWRSNLKLNDKTKKYFDTYLINRFSHKNGYPDIIIFGHKHTHLLFDKEYRGIRWISCPRGMTTLEL